MSFRCPRCQSVHGTKDALARCLQAHGCDKNTAVVLASHAILGEDGDLDGMKETKVVARATAPSQAAGITMAQGPGAHVCPGCGTSIACDYAAIEMLEEEARRLKIVAGMWRARLAGVHIGRPRVHEFDLDAARALVGSGLSQRATAKLLGVHPESVRRALKATQ